jgi:hypothetical protein
LSVTPQPKYQTPFGPMVPGVKVGKLNDIEALEGLIDKKTCGVIVEPIQGEGGVYEASEEFLMALRERCNEVGAVLIYDEIQVSSHRRWLLTIVRFIADGEVMGSRSFPACCCSGYSYDSETLGERFSHRRRSGISSSGPGNQNRRSRYYTSQSPPDL